LISGGAETAQSQAIASNISQLADQDPEGAVRALGLLAAFQGKSNHTQQNLGPLLLGVPIYEALGAALLVGAGAAATPAGQESLAAAANAVMEASTTVAGDAQEQLRLSAELWALVVGTPFPIHTLDPKYGTLVNPIVDLEGKNPASGGYAEGGRVITTPHTGGNQLDGQQGGTGYTTPEHQLNPGNMYSETSKVLQTGGNKINSATAGAVNESFGVEINSREWGRMLEALKKDVGLRNDFHGKILSNGDYLSSDGAYVGNIGDYMK